MQTIVIQIKFIKFVKIKIQPKWKMKKVILR